MRKSAAILVALGLTSVTQVASADRSKRHSFLNEATIDYEVGGLLILQNDGRYGENGTDFGVDETNQRENLVLASRTSVELVLGSSRLILLYAPLDLTTRATLEDDLRFRDQLYAGGSSIEHRYLFDGYRASYTYELPFDAIEVQVGGSLQIRNAKVAFSLADGSNYEEESDIGLVPALKLRATYQEDDDHMFVMVDADGSSTFGLVGDTEGGLYDVGLTLGFPLGKTLDLFLRARFIGGGATVPDRELENWAHFAAATAGLRFDLAGFD